MVLYMNGGKVVWLQSLMAQGRSETIAKKWPEADNIPPALGCLAYVRVKSKENIDFVFIEYWHIDWVYTPCAALSKWAIIIKEDRICLSMIWLN